MKKLLPKLIMFCMLLAGTALAQGAFSSGSTGADGAFAPTQSATIQVPASGVFNYTTVNVPSGVTITYIPNANNTALTILATGDVTISGALVVDGQPGSATSFAGFGGPGGFSGGAGSVNSSPGSNADGPGGGGGASGSNAPGGGGGYQTAGGASNGAAGAKYGSSIIPTLIGGSGGGGGGGNSSMKGGGGGGGGGAILIASSTSIIFPGSGTPALISSNGGPGAGVSGTSAGGGGGGSGGAIRLIANTISGLVHLTAAGGTGGDNGFQNAGNGGNGYIRAEAYNLTSFSPSTSQSISSGTPNLPPAGNLPTLQIASVAGVSAPANPLGSFQDAPDVVLPSNQTNPVTVVVNAANIPNGTSVTLTAVPASGTAAAVSASLSGSTASSSASFSISLPSTFSVLTATTTTLVSDSRPMFLNGEKVEKIEIAASFGASSQVIYITHSGRRVAPLR